MNILKKKYVFIVLALALQLLSCQSLERDAKNLQRTLQLQEERANEITDLLVDALDGNSFDSIWQITQATANENPILFYVFSSTGMLYWSDNWLATSQITLTHYDQWDYQQFDNAHAVCRWTKAGDYNILTVIPIKHNYPFENQQLHNTFIPPFRSRTDAEISIRKHEGCIPVCAQDGTCLFYLCNHPEEKAELKQGKRLTESFSYHSLLTTDNSEEGIGRRAQVRMYFILCLVLFLLLIIVGTWGLLYSKGIRRMKLSFRFMYLLATILLLSYFCFFLVSVNYTRRHYSARQQSMLQQKTRYIQKSLQDMYFWNIGLNERNAAGLNVDLRDLSFTYETDINVYDMNGNLLASSTPVLFEKGIISTHIAPEPFFSEAQEMLRKEQIGDMQYLAGYCAFLNGNYVQIGYIEVPSFISEDEVNAEVDALLARILPIFLVVLIIALFISVAMTRTMTRPLNTLSDSLQHLKIGQRNAHLSYQGSDEVGVLVSRYNELVDQLEDSAERLARSEREGAWRTMARQIAHEINNPLTPMKLTIQQLQRCKGTDRFDAYFDKSTALLIEQIDNLSRIAQSFSAFAKMPDVKPSEVDIATKLCSVINLFRNNQENVPIRYVGADEGVLAMADAEQISQVFTNLIKNALQAIENTREGDIIIILKDMDNQAEITISDNGCGIPEEIRAKVFMPNFTTKSTGTGLGLAISKNIVEGSGGQITFDTSDKGTTFRVLLRKSTATLA